MGRNAKPIELLLIEGKKHLTNAEKESRKNSEIKCGSNKLKCPDYIKNNIKAYSKWREILKIYKDVDFVSSGDIGLLGRYCMTFTQYHNLLDRLSRIKDISEDSDDVDDALLNTEEFTYKVKKQIGDMISTDGILRIEKAINQKMDMLLKMEDRLFLSPLAKVKNIPKKEEATKPVSKFDKFKSGDMSG